MQWKALDQRYRFVVAQNYPSCCLGPDTQGGWLGQPNPAEVGPSCKLHACLPFPKQGAGDTPQVVVTGAGGRTGKLVVKKLLAQPDKFTPIATVRSKSNAGKLTSEGLPESALVEFDLAAAAAAGSAPADLQAALQGADALVIATSGVPQIKPLSLIPVIWAKITGKEGVRPEFTWKQGQMPEQVRLQIENFMAELHAELTGYPPCICPLHHKAMCMCMYGFP